MTLQNAFGDIALDATVQDAVTELNAIYTVLGAKATTADIAALGVKLDSLIATSPALESGRVPVVLSGSVPITDGGGSVTVDGTVAVSNTTFPVTDNGGSLTVDGTVAVTDGGGSITVDGTVAVSNPTFPVTDNGGSLTVDDGGSSLTVDGTVAFSNTSIAVTDNGGSLTIDAASLPLPTGASTESTLSALNTKVPVQGQALSAASLPVVLPAAQITTLTPPAAITGFATQATLESLRAQSDTGIRAVRRDADTAPVADGGSHNLNTNAIGRLKTSVLPGATANVTGTITAAAQTVVADVSRASNVVVDINGTFTGVNVTFETTVDGTNWKAEQGLRSNAATIESVSGVIATGIAYSWEFSVNAKSQFRVRSTAWVSGTANVTIGIGAFATEPFVTVPTHAVTGSGTFTTSGAVTAVTPGVAATSLGKAEDAAHVSGDTGVAILAVRNDNAATDQTSANNDYGFPSVDIKGASFVRTRPGLTSTLSNVAASVSSVTVLAANAARRIATVHNDSSAICYLKWGATASTSSYTVQIPSQGYYEVPDTYTGVLDAVWASATGNARVTELV